MLNLSCQKALSNKTITKLFNLEGVIFKDLYFEEETVRVLVASSYQAAICPHCCKPTNKLVKLIPKTFRDSDFGGRYCLIEIDHKQLECRHCYKTFMEHLPFARPFGHYTTRFENQVYECCKESSALYTANKFGISQTAVTNIYRRICEERERKNAQEEELVTAIGFDEISMHKGHKDFILIITDISNKKVLDVLPDRKKETLEAYLKTWPQEKRNNIKSVAIDLWGPYRSVAEDFFHKQKLLQIASM